MNDFAKTCLQNILSLYVRGIVSQRSSLELASLVAKAGSSPQNVWPISYDIGVSQVATQLRQFKNVM